MRSMIFAVLVAATTISVASAEDLSTQAPPPSGAMIDNLPGISAEQEIAIPYTPCVQPMGWVNGRLRCDNRY